MARGSQLAVLWFTQDENHQPVIKFARSQDQGVSFSGPIVIDQGTNIGRLAGTCLEDGSAIVAWFDVLENDKLALKARLITQDGKVHEAIKVADVVDSRRSGFPTLTSDGKRAIISWTDLTNEVVGSAVIEIQKK